MQQTDDGILEKNLCISQLTMNEKINIRTDGQKPVYGKLIIIGKGKIKRTLSFHFSTINTTKNNDLTRKTGNMISRILCCRKIVQLMIAEPLSL